MIIINVTITGREIAIYSPLASGVDGGSVYYFEHHNHQCHTVLTKVLSKMTCYIFSIMNWWNKQSKIKPRQSTTSS